MSSLFHAIAQQLQSITKQDGPNPTAVPGVHIVRFSSIDRPSKRNWRACLAIVAQGSKEIQLGSDVFLAKVGDYTATPISLPVVSRIASASSSEPFLGLLFDIDPQVLNELARQLELDAETHEKNPVRAFFSGHVDDNILDSVQRLSKLLAMPSDARVLGPLIVKEIFYHFLKGPEGVALRQYLQTSSKFHRVSQVVHQLRLQLDNELDVNALAKSSKMSRSAFFQAFKEVTAMSPIQYQKRLRLLEAKRLMLEHAETAEGAAFKVGYKSASQFSREYTRMFGNSPLRDIRGTPGP